MGHDAVRRLSVLGLLAAIALGAAAEERGPGRWLDLKTPGGNVAMDSGGQLWAAAPGGLRYWDGRQLVSPKLNEMAGKAPSNYVMLCGDQGTGAYALISGSEPNQGLAYRLADGEVRLLTDFYRDPSSNGPRFCISRTGVMINWGQRFLATRRGGEWQRTEARLNDRPCILNLAHYVVFATNGWIYTVDAEGRITELAAPELAASQGDFDGMFTGRAETGDTAHLGNQRTGAYYTFDAATGQLTPLLIPQPGTPAGEQSAMPAASAKAARFAGRRYFPTADGSLKIVDNVSASLVPAWAPPESEDMRGRLAASDGSYWTGLSGGTVAHCADGKLTVYDWHDGLRFASYPSVLEGAGGQIFVCAQRTIYAFLADQPPEPPAPWVALWDEFHLDSDARPAQDSDGRIWVRMWDSPGEFSVWDGKQWTQRKVDFDGRSVYPVLVDDRGHLLVTTFGFAGRAYVVGLDGTKSYESIHAMLPALVADGVRHFSPVGDTPPCYVLANGRIWNGHEYYDGEEWTQIWEGSDRLYESPRYGVLFWTIQGSRYSYYDRGQFVPLPVPQDRATFWLLGKSGLQPFELELLKLHPGAFLPAVRMPGDKFYLLREMPASTDADPPLSALGGELPQYDQGARAGLPPVYYLTASSGVARCTVQGKAVAFSLAGTPLEGREGFALQVMVDPAHNLVFMQDRSAFIKRTGDFRIVAGPAPDRVGKVLPLDVRLEQPGLDAGKGYVFWRTNDGPWQGGVPPGKVEVTFAESGRYRVELIGVDPLGGVTPQPVKLSVRAAGPDAAPVLQRKLDEARKAGHEAEDLKDATEMLSEPASAGGARGSALSGAGGGAGGERQ